MDKSPIPAFPPLRVLSKRVAFARLETKEITPALAVLEGAMPTLVGHGLVVIRKRKGKKALGSVHGFDCSLCPFDPSTFSYLGSITIINLCKEMGYGGNPGEMNRGWEPRPCLPLSFFNQSPHHPLPYTEEVSYYFAYSCTIRYHSTNMLCHTTSMLPYILRWSGAISRRIDHGMQVPLGYYYSFFLLSIYSSTASMEE